MSSAKRVAVIGIDCLTPQLVFERYLEQLPTFQKLLKQSCWGPLRSTIPPITVPAWMCMATSQDPGQLGLYGFRNRLNHSYGEMGVADASWIRKPTLWQLLSRRRRRSLVLGVPLTYPPRPIMGELVCGVPVPADAPQMTAPPQLKQELDRVSGDQGYLVDVGNFRTQDPAELAAALEELRDNRFAVAEHLATTREWDLLFMVEMSVDRLHHAFWAHGHPEHPLHDPQSPFLNLMLDFYRGLDARLGELIDKLGPETAVLVVSDHGAKTMVGGVRFNEWLLQQGWLVLKQRPAKLSRLSTDDIDWSRTKAWCDGGYYARTFLNVAGREPQGVVQDYEGCLVQLKRMLEDMPGPEGRTLGNRVFLPRDTYRDCNNVVPDLIVYPGDLDYRANATVFPLDQLPSGEQAVFTVENDTGVDGANHAQDGVLVYRPADASAQDNNGRIEASIYDIAPTVLQLLGEKVPDHMIGRSLS